MQAFRMSHLATLLVTATVLHCAHAEPVRFAVIGDLPYNGADERNLLDVQEDIARSSSAFVIHLGDIKSGSEYCGDALLDQRIRLMEQSTKPLVYVPGDNEWTDCHRRPAGGFDPVERLNWLRKRAFSAPRSLGQQILAIEQQGNTDTASADSAKTLKGLPENLRWQQGKVLFVTFNVPGSNNNDWAQFPPDHERNSEFAQRSPLNEAWLRDSIQKARQSEVSALVIAFQGNPFERDSAEQQSHLRDGFGPWRQLLAAQLKALGKPVLLVHGDTHQYRIDQALKDEQGKPVPNVTRLEAFGYPFTRNWVEVSVDTSKAQAFSITPRRLLQTEP